jgi:hypothetical protein
VNDLFHVKQTPFLTHPYLEVRNPMATFTLDDIRSTAEAKYGSTDIDMGGAGIVVLRNALRLSSDERQELLTFQEKLSAGKDDEDAPAVSGEEVQIVSDMIRLVAADKALADKMLATIGDDLGVLMELVGQYSEGTQLGEASASAN